MLHIATRARAIALPILALLSNPLVAQDEPQGEPEFADYKLQTGEEVRGAILQTDGDRIQMRVSIAGGAGRATSWYDLAAFDAPSQVRLRRELLEEGDVEGQLGVAEFAANKGLFQLCKTELRRAFMLAEGQPKGTYAHLKPRALDLINAILADMCARGQIAEARAAVSRFLTKQGGNLTDEEQARLLDTVETASEAKRDQAAAERRAKQDAKTQADIERKISRARQLRDHGNEARRKALLNSKQFSAASRDFELAAKRFEQAIAEAEKVKKTFANEKHLVAELDAAIDETWGLWRDSILGAASLRLTRGQFTAAMGAVNRVLEKDPENAEAKAMRARIEVASNDWGYGRIW